MKNLQEEALRFEMILEREVLNKEGKHTNPK